MNEVLSMFGRILKILHEELDDFFSHLWPENLVPVNSPCVVLFSIAL